MINKDDNVKNEVESCVKTKNRSRRCIEVFGEWEVECRVSSLVYLLQS